MRCVLAFLTLASIWTLVLAAAGVVAEFQSDWPPTWNARLRVIGRITSMVAMAVFGVGSILGVLLFFALAISCPDCGICGYEH